MPLSKHRPSPVICHVLKLLTLLNEFATCSSNPFATNPSHAPDAFQLKLIDILNDSNLKTAYDHYDLVIAYKQYVSSETSPNLSGMPTERGTGANVHGPHDL